MRQSWVFILLLCVLSGGLWAAEVIVPADVSCRCEGFGYADTNRHDSSKLSVRASSNGVKSWIKFDQLAAYDLSTLRAAVLTVSLHNPKGGSQQCGVSAVNDDCLDNIGWLEREITWNNAPGNDTTSLSLLDAAKTTFVETLTFTDGLAGDSFDIDVLAVLQADTDGVVQFVLHNSPNLLDFATWDHATVEWRPYLTLTFPPAGADLPNPADGDEQVPTSLAMLDWVNPEPNSPGDPIFCDVYFGTEPNRLEMFKAELGADISEAALTAENFDGLVLPLTNYTTYYWVVDCHDGENLIEGEMWSFYTNNNEAPVVDAGADQATWLDPSPLTVTLSGSVSDDGLPVGGQLTSLWEQVNNGAPTTPVIEDATTPVTNVTITEAGDYEFRLTAHDGGILDPSADSVRIVVGTDACDASHVFTGQAYNPADANEDCIVDLADLQLLIVDAWLNCTDVLTDCGF